MSAKHGNLSINSDNIFPIIKKWMYSDHDIFVRELVSNGCDAITKLKKLDGMGEYLSLIHIYSLEFASSFMQPPFTRFLSSQ